MGRLTRDPELRVTPGGLHICKFGLAVGRKFKGQDGEMKEETTFIDVDSFGKQAEVIAKYFAKGRLIFMEGRLKLDQWDSPEGQKRSKLGVVLESFQFMGSAGDGQSAGSSSSEGYENVSPAKRGTASVAAVSSAEIGEFDDDVPF